MNPKRIPLWLLSAACLVPLGSQANDIEPGKEYYSAIHAPRPIVLDGDLSEWSGVPVLADPKFSIPKGSGDGGTLVLFEEYAGGTWTGPDDQTSAVQIAYDADNVYFGFIVTDDYHENAARSAWNGDSIQLMIANAERTQQVALYNYALGGVEEDENLNDPSNLVEGSRHEAGPPCALDGSCATEVAIKRNTTTKKTTYEIKLPKASLGLASLTGGVKFGLGMAINDGDKDTPGQKGWGGLGAHAIVFGKSPGETALVTLARKNDIEPGKEVYTANPAPKPIVLDGNLSEWSGVPVLADPKFSIPKGSGPAGTGTLVLFEEYAGGTWTGPDDQTSAVQIVYDAENIYFGFVVTDDYHENAARSAWNGDSIQLMIASAAQGQQVALYNYALGGVEDDPDLNNPANLVQDVRHEAGPPCITDQTCLTDVAITRNTTTKKTTYEIRLPRAALGLAQLDYGTQFGLGMAINDGDQDTPGQKGWGGLGAHAIVFGKTPGETALVTLGVGGTAADLIYLSAVNPSPEGFSFRVNNLGPSICDPATAKLFIDGTLVTLTVTPKTDAFDFAYTRPTPFPPRSEHTYIIEVKDTAGHTVSDAGSFTLPAYALLTADMKVTPDTTKRGFVWRVHQNSAFQANTTTRALEQLAGLLGVNLADRNAQNIAIAPGTAGANNRLPIQFEIDSTINMSPDAGLYGYFPTDDYMPGLPGSDPNSDGTDGVAGEVITYIDLPVGKHTLVVQSDDGFRTTAGYVGDVFLAQTAADSAGAVANTVYSVYVQDAGVYAFRTVWGEGGGTAYLEWASVQSDGTTRVLLNDTANGGLRTYRAVTGKGPATINFVSPVPGATGVAFDAPIVVTIQDGQNAIDAGSVKLTLDGVEVNVQPTKAGDVTTVNYQPPAYLASGSQHTAGISFTAGGVARSETWTFTVQTYPTLAKPEQAVSVDKTKPGFRWSVFQNETVLPNSLASCEQALAGQLTGPDGTVLPNLADPASYGMAEGPGVKVGPLYQFQIPTVLNLSQNAEAAGNFSTSATDPLLFVPDDPIPGIPGTTGSTDGIDGEVITFVELPAGVITFGVASDDSFRMQGGYINTPADAVLMSQVDGATANLTFRCVVKDAGVYPIRVIWQEGGGGANLELFTVKADGARALLNDTANGGYRCYRVGVAPERVTEFSLSVSLSGTNVRIEWTQAGVVLQESSDLKTWTDLPNATSPYTAATSAAATKFYRLKL